MKRFKLRWMQNSWLHHLRSPYAKELIKVFYSFFHNLEIFHIFHWKVYCFYRKIVPRFLFLGKFYDFTNIINGRSSNNSFCEFGEGKDLMVSISFKFEFSRLCLLKRKNGFCQKIRNFIIFRSTVHYIKNITLVLAGMT